MTNLVRLIASAAAAGSLAVPAAAQYYPQPTYPQQTYPQQYPQYQQPTYPGTSYGQYGYQQNYSQNPVQQIIDSLLGNRYNVTDRTAVSQCATAAMAQANAQYGGGYGGYGGGYNNSYSRGYSNLRVTSITDVQRRNNGLRVSGLMSSGYGGQYGGQYGSQYGYQNQGYGQQLSFRCNVDYRGAVTNIRIRQSNNYYRR